jgi:hypothetical protein
MQDGKGRRQNTGVRRQKIGCKMKDAKDRRQKTEDRMHDAGY